jgi:hypothetical protein
MRFMEGGSAALHTYDDMIKPLVTRSAMARSVSAAPWYRSPVSAARQDATIATSSIVAPSQSSR